MLETETCDICYKTVEESEEGLLCDKCHIWKHRQCIGMGQTSYQKISKSKEQWVCGKCDKNPGRSETKTSNHTINDVMHALQNMERKYDIIFQKYEEELKLIEQLRVELSGIKDQLNKRDQKELSKNIIVYRVPYKANEDLQQLVSQIGSELLVELDNNFTAFRVGAKENGMKTHTKINFKDEDIQKKLMKSHRKYILDSIAVGLIR